MGFNQQGLIRYMFFAHKVGCIADVSSATDSSPSPSGAGRQLKVKSESA